MSKIDNKVILKVFLGLLGFLWLASCTKKEYKDVVVPNNQAPVDSIVSREIIENYINKTYINLLGRKATEQEFETKLNSFLKDNLSPKSRLAFIQEITQSKEYRKKIFELNLSRLLKNRDTSEAVFFIKTYTDQLKIETNPFTRFYLETAIERFKLFYASGTDFVNKKITHVELHKRLIFNPFYDEINMGTENFVLSLFEHFFLRYPTNAELVQAKKMVDGEKTIVFRVEGENKANFIDIFFNSTEYDEGQVRDVFRRLVYREPNSVELAKYTALHNKTKDLSAIETEILISNEYAGIK